MGKYFRYFPVINYSLDANPVTGAKERVTDITFPVTLLEPFLNDKKYLFEYQVSDGATPERVATAVYNDPERHWIILHVNKILNPQFDWPLSATQLDNYVELKYGSIENARQSDNVRTWVATAGQTIFEIGRLVDLIDIEAIPGYDLGGINYNIDAEALDLAEIIAGGNANAYITLAELLYASANTLDIANMIDHLIVLDEDNVETPNVTFDLEAETMTFTDGREAGHNITLIIKQSHSYYKITRQYSSATYDEVSIVKERISADDYYSFTPTTSDNPFVFDNGETLSLTTSKQALSYYDYEIQQNEKKATIQLLDVNVIEQIEAKFRGIATRSSTKA